MITSVGTCEQPEDLSEIMDFSAYDLRTTIRLIVLSGESRMVQIKKMSQLGNIYIKCGEIYRSETNDLSGDEAFFAMLSWRNASHSDAKQPRSLESNMGISTAVLLDLLESGGL
jgi:hypothetical protein